MKGQRKMKAGRGNGRNKQTRQIDYEECATKMKDFASRIKKAGNLDRQSKRIEDFMKLTEKKMNNSGNFEETQTALIKGLGGNESAPICRTAGFDSEMINSALSALKSCKANIEKDCKMTPMTSNDTDEITACKEAGESLSTEVDDCIKPSKDLSTTCTCFMGLSRDSLNKVISCDITEIRDKVTGSKKLCVKGKKYF